MEKQDAFTQALLRAMDAAEQEAGVRQPRLRRAVELRLFLQRQARDYFRQEYPMQRLALYDVAPLETGIGAVFHRTHKKPGEGITIEQKAVLPYAIPHGIFDMAPDLEHYLRFVAQNGVGHLYVTPHNRRIVQLLHIREHGRLLPELFVPAD